jgi:hypothetical protein
MGKMKSRFATLNVQFTNLIFAVLLEHFEAHVAESESSGIVVVQQFLEPGAHEGNVVVLLRSLPQTHKMQKKEEKKKSFASNVNRKSE